MKRDELRIMSTQLLGHMYRLEVACALADWPGRTVNGTELAEVTGIPYARIQQELKRLAEAGMVRHKERRGSHTRDYTIGKSVYWTLAVQLRAELERRRG